MSRKPKAIESAEQSTVDPVDPVELAGYRAYEDGETDDACPYSANSPDGVRWLRGLNQAMQTFLDSAVLVDPRQTALPV